MCMSLCCTSYCDQRTSWDLRTTFLRLEDVGAVFLFGGLNRVWRWALLTVHVLLGQVVVVLVPDAYMHNHHKLALCASAGAVAWRVSGPRILCDKDVWRGEKSDDDRGKDRCGTKKGKRLRG